MIFLVSVRKIEFLGSIDVLEISAWFLHSAIYHRYESLYYRHTWQMTDLPLAILLRIQLTSSTFFPSFLSQLS